jgi:hypothetical protein
MQTLQENCRDFTVTLDSDAFADYMILVEEGEPVGSGNWLVGVFDGILKELVSIRSAPTLPEAIRAGCAVVRQNENEIGRP